MATRRGPDNSIRVAAQGNIGSAAWANIFWVQTTISGTPTQADVDAWLTLFVAKHTARQMAIMNNIATRSAITATFFLAGGSVIQSVNSTAATGANAATAVADAAACRVISWTTSVYWRGGKPRTYVPTVSVADVVGNNQLGATPKADLVTAANNLRTDVATITSGAITASVLGFVSFRTGNADRPVPIFYPFLGARAHGRLGTQRRRLGHWTQ